MIVTPITITQIDYPSLLRAGRDATGRNLSTILDKLHQPLETHLSFLAILGAVDGRTLTPIEAAHQDLKNLSHLFFGFSIEAEPSELSVIVRIIGGRLHMTIDPSWRFMILSGNLAAWKLVLPEARLSEAFGIILGLFSSYGLRAVFE